MSLPKKGDRIRLDAMPHDPDPITPGTLGTVEEVVEFDPPLPTSHTRWGPNFEPLETQLPAEDVTAQLWVKWDDGRTLNVCIPGDRFTIMEDA